MVITYHENIMLRKKLISEKELSDINFESLEKVLICIENNLIDSDDNMYLNVDSSIAINNITTGSNVNTLRKVNFKPYGYDKMNIDKNLKKDKLYQLIDQFNGRKFNHGDFYFALLDNIHPFYDGNERACRILYVSNFS